MKDNSALAAGTHDISIDGIRLRYHVAGTGPVCLFHSGGPGAEWDYLRAPRLEAHLTCVYVEPVGTKGSGRLPGHPHGYTVELYSHFLHGLITHLGVPKLHLLGHSHGGFVAQRYALDHPDRLAGLILYGTAPTMGPDLWEEADRQIEAFAHRHEAHPGVEAVAQAWATVAEVVDDDGIIQKMRVLFPAYFADYWGREAEFAPAREAFDCTYIAGVGAASPFDLRDELGAIAPPTLVIGGEYDFICGMRWARQMHGGIPGSEMAVLMNSGHFGHLEEPEKFAERVLGFILQIQ
ncbi:MAG TPA: alpha/beta hydrolase [Aliidongia sp.]|nr:alpha/beta hydrolase [Aliidongia sp.]